MWGRAAYFKATSDTNGITFTGSTQNEAVIFSGTGYILKLKKHDASALLFPDKLVEYPEVPKISACHYPCLLSSRPYLKTLIFGMWPGCICWFRNFVEVPNEGRWDQPLMIFFKILFAFDFYLNAERLVLELVNPRTFQEFLCGILLVR